MDARQGEDPLAGLRLCRQLGSARRTPQSSPARQGEAIIASCATQLHHADVAGPDITPYHDRQVVMQGPEVRAACLYLRVPQGELLLPLPESSFDVEIVRQGAT